MFSNLNKKMAPVLICGETLTTMVITIIDNEAGFAESSDWLMFTIEGLKKAIEMHMREVPHSLDSWSRALGIEVVRSLGSLVAIESSVSVKEFSTKNRQGIHSFFRRIALKISQSMRMRHTKVATAM
ncbi:hypothetical protein Syun_030612 [Stephania yunnanensis]|uniref:Uncharacterized protein n=1 Tax=Stephania yunnanensis TaxID=152371 RepID=A0AAP0E1T0_9MAGN